MGEIYLSFFFFFNEGYNDLRTSIFEENLSSFVPRVTRKLLIKNMIWS